MKVDVVPTMETWKLVEFSMKGLLDNLVNALIDGISMDFYGFLVFQPSR